MKIPNHSNREGIALKMAPMIDVVFLLLVFFIWTSSFEIPEFDLPSAIAQPAVGSLEASIESPPPEPYDEIVVRLLFQDGRTAIRMNDSSIDSLADLTERMTEIVSIGVQPAVIIDPAGAVKVREAVAAYDAIRESGIDRILFAITAD